MIILNMLVWISGVCNVANCVVCAISMQYHISIIKHARYILGDVICRSWINMWLKCFGTCLCTLHSIVMEGRTCTSDIPDYQDSPYFCNSTLRDIEIIHVHTRMVLAYMLDPIKHMHKLCLLEWLLLHYLKDVYEKQV